MNREGENLVFSPTDLVRYVASPFASWMDRYNLDYPGVLTPDDETEDQKLIARTGDEHEQAELAKFRAAFPLLVEIGTANSQKASEQTVAAIKADAPIIYRARLSGGRFSGYSDFLVRDPSAGYQVWDTKLAVAPKPYYAIQLCCYSEMLSEMSGAKKSSKFGIILGNGVKVEFLVNDFFDYYLGIREGFMAMQDAFSGNLFECPEPAPRADHGRWSSHA